MNHGMCNLHHPPRLLLTIRVKIQINFIGYMEDVTTNYKVEDFLWSGSGDGDNETDVNVADEDVWWQYTTTIFQTTTVMWTSTATVYRNKHHSTPSIIIKPVSTVYSRKPILTFFVSGH